MTTYIVGFSYFKNLNSKSLSDQAITPLDPTICREFNQEKNWWESMTTCSMLTYLDSKLMIFPNFFKRKISRRIDKKEKEKSLP